MDPDDVVARIFVGGLDHDCDEGDLVKAFSMFGEISQVMVMKDHETSQSRGFGFISFQEQDAADDAIRRMHGVEIMGRCVTVRKAEKQGNVGDRPRRGGFRGGRGGGGDRFGGRSDSRYESRGRGSYSSGRRQSNDGYQGGYRGRGRTYGDTRRGGFDSSRLGHSSRGSYSDKRGGYNDGSRSGRPGGYNNRRQDNDFEDVGSRYADDRYSSRKTYGDDRYVDSRRDESSRGYGSMSTRDSYNSSRYETSARGRSRSPIGRTVYREESPVPTKTYRTGETYREFSPPAVRQSTRVREYSPVLNSRSGYGESNLRDYSPPAPSRGKAHRDPSPEFAPIRGRGRIESSPPRERPATYSSRSSGYKSPPLRRSEYSSSRSQEFSGREGRYDSAGSRGGRPANGQDRAPGSRSTYAGHSDGPPRSSRYASSRPGGSPPISRAAPRDFPPRGLKHRQSGSPVERRSARRI